MVGRTRMGTWGVEATAARLADIHGALLASVHCLAAWIAAVPELERKIAWAYHLYDHARLADLIGQRIHTLTAERPEIPSPANRPLLRFLQELAGLETPAAQTAGLYGVLLPALLQSCREHLAGTNPVADEPTVRLLAEAAEALEAQVIWAAHQPMEDGALQHMRLALTGAGGLHGPGHAVVESVPPAGGAVDGPPTKAQGRSKVEPAAGHAGGLAGLHPVLVATPARDARFRPLEPGKRMPKAKSLQTPEGRIRLLHIALINLEIPAIEVCGRMMVDFPDAPWELKLDLARQIWDEARHAQMCADRLQELGGSLGQFPCHHKVWEHSLASASLAERFITTQRIHEGNGLDQTLLAREALAEIGDMATAQIMDYIMADEVIHVRNGNKWLERLVASPEERTSLLRRVEERLGVAAVAGPPVNRVGRRRAGFTEIELDWLTSLRERKGSHA